MTEREARLTAEELLVVSEIRRALKSGRARRRREGREIRLAEFARLLGVSTAAVSQWERGLRVPEAGNALAYARELAALERKAA